MPYSIVEILVCGCESLKCPKCGYEMKILNLPSEAHYGAERKKKLHVCIHCGYEREFIGGDKCR